MLDQLSNRTLGNEQGLFSGPEAYIILRYFKLNIKSHFPFFLVATPSSLAISLCYLVDIQSSETTSSERRPPKRK